MPVILHGILHFSRKALLFAPTGGTILLLVPTRFFGRMRRKSARCGQNVRDETACFDPGGAQTALGTQNSKCDRALTAPPEFKSLMLRQTEKPAVYRRAFFVSWRRGRRRPGTPRRRAPQQAPLLKGGRERRSGGCFAAKCRQKEAAAAAGQPLRCAASFKRQPAVRQSLRPRCARPPPFDKGGKIAAHPAGSRKSTPPRAPCRGAHCAPG